MKLANFDKLGQERLAQPFEKIAVPSCFATWVLRFSQINLFIIAVYFLCMQIKHVCFSLVPK